MSRIRENPFLTFNDISPTTRMFVKVAAALKATDLQNFAIAPLFNKAIEIHNSQNLDTQLPPKPNTFTEARAIFKSAATAQSVDMGKLADSVLNVEAVEVIGKEATEALLKRFRNDGIHYD